MTDGRGFSSPLFLLNFLFARALANRAAIRSDTRLPCIHKTGNFDNTPLEIEGAHETKCKGQQTGKRCAAARKEIGHAGKELFFLLSLSNAWRAKKKRQVDQSPSATLRASPRRARSLPPLVHISHCGEKRPHRGEGGRSQRSGPHRFRRGFSSIASTSPSLSLSFFT